VDFTITQPLNSATLTALATALCLLVPADYITMIIVYFALYMVSIALLIRSMASAVRNRLNKMAAGA